MRVVRKGVQLMKKALLILVIIFFSGYCYAMGGNPPETKGDTMAKGGSNIVVIETSKGKMRVELYPDKTPVTVQNFLSYIDKGHYDGTIFHRVIPGFMIQGGGFEKGLAEKGTQSPIKNEAGQGIKNERGTIAMARTNIVDSATSQFFINVADNDFLNHQNDSQQGYGYCAFGKVIEGMDVADAISRAERHSVSYYDDVPVEDIVIVSVKRE